MRTEGNMTGDGARADVAPARPSSFYAGWRVFALGLLLSAFAAGPVYYAYGNYAVAFSGEFGVSRAAINLGYTAVLLVGNLGSAPVGWLLGRWPVRRVALIGAVGTGLGLGLVGFASAFWQVLLLFATLIACADVFLGVVIVNYLLCHWFERRRGLVLSLVQVGTSAGAILFPPLTALITADFGWRTVFLVYGAMVVLLAIPILVYARVPPRIPESEAVATMTRRSDGPLHNYASIWRHAPFWIITVAIGTMIGVNASTLVSLVPFAASIGLGVAAGSVLVSILGGAALVGKIAYSLVADRLDVKQVMRAALVLFASGQALFASSRSLPLLELGAALTGLALGGMMPAWGLVCARVFGLRSYGIALGGTRAAMTPIAFVCPMLVGALYDRFDSYQPAWLALVAIVLVALGFTFLRRSWDAPLAS